MKILVVSDTHGAIFESIVAPILKEKNIDILIHCGDKYYDGQKLAQMVGVKEYYTVVGNCDHDIKDGKNMLDLNIENKRILVTHGHFQHVKDGLELLKTIAEEKSADIVLFGHTHICYNQIDNDILYFNPGSTILPKWGKASYGIIEIINGKVTSKVINL